MARRKLSKKQTHHITQKRIRTLFDLAYDQMKKNNNDLARRYIIHARKLSMKNVSPIPGELKHLYCKHCYTYLLPNQTCHVRIKHGIIIKQCLHCRKIKRIPFK